MLSLCEQVTISDIVTIYSLSPREVCLEEKTKQTKNNTEMRKSNQPCLKMHSEHIPCLMSLMEIVLIQQITQQCSQ